MKLKFRLAAILIAIVGIFPASVTMLAQTWKETPAAPIPSQILTAKKVFISNARAEWNSVRWSGSPERTYNEFYAAIKNMGRYQIVATPGDADMVLQITFLEPLESNGNTQVSSPLFRLLLVDPKTNTILWTLDEHVQVDSFQKSRDKRFDDGISNIVRYLNALYSQPVYEIK